MDKKEWHEEQRGKERRESSNPLLPLLCRSEPSGSLAWTHIPNLATFYIRPLMKSQSTPKLHPSVTRPQSKFNDLYDLKNYVFLYFIVTLNS